MLQGRQQQKCDPHGRIKCAIGIVAAVVLFFAVTQTTLLLVLTCIRPDTCEIEINSTDCDEIAAEFENNSTYFEAIEMLRIVYSFMTIPEYAVLLHGLYKLLIKTTNPLHKSETHSSLNPNNKIKKKKSFENLKDIKAWIGIPLASVFIIIFAVASLATPIMDMIYACKVNHCCKEQQLFYILSVAYESVHLIVHALSPVIVGGMVYTVLEVKAIWFRNDMKDKKKTDDTAKSTPTDNQQADDIPDDFAKSTLTVNEKAAIKEYYKQVTEYKQCIAKIKPLFRVFQTWFAFQWFHYFFQTVTDFTQTIHQWITGTNHPDLVIAYRGVHTAFDVLAFAIPHVCGLKLNACHQEYLRRARKEQLEAAKGTKSKLGIVKAYSLTIEKDNGGDFVPRIPGTGIKIPLDNPGYTLSILLTIFALIASFVNFSR